MSKKTGHKHSRHGTKAPHDTGDNSDANTISLNRFDLSQRHRVVFAYRILPGSESKVHAFCKKNIREFLSKGPKASLADFCIVKVNNESLLLSLLDHYDNSDLSANWARIDGIKDVLGVERLSFAILSDCHFEIKP